MVGTYPVEYCGVGGLRRGCDERGVRASEYGCVVHMNVADGVVECDSGCVMAIGAARVLISSGWSGAGGASSFLSLSKSPRTNVALLFSEKVVSNFAGLQPPHLR